MERKILVSITTTKKDYFKKIEEVKYFKIKEIALFLTSVDSKERNKIYKRLEKVNITIPFIHLRTDINSDEIEYLIKNYKTKKFNTHSEKDYHHINDWSKYKNKIYVENVYHLPNKEELTKFAGICLDLSHFKNDSIENLERYKKTKEFLNKFPIGCNHISAIRNSYYIAEEGEHRYDNHCFKNLKEFDYLKEYPLNYFSDTIAIELENSIEDQLKVKKYITKIITR